jgi:signal transduction histidine kinase
MLATQDIERARQVPEVDATQRAQGSARDLAVAGPGSVLVAVKDNGTGPDPAVEERMFQPFFTTKPDGLGMGLAICRSIVEAHGGGLWAAPRAPQGADVRFTERRQCANSGQSLAARDELKIDSIAVICEWL